ncbi:MG2 domain-containing protein [Moheibacter sediminis]|uniref:TonB-dependent outer membrane receptor, SusC/RagA subfamily, signature region n=1 Tax=Moheibacter sediminis TaxID=1434700 RepID=A0A1W2C7D8_9FLAO|nr:MG2 domain-containing protein [Moheibacter sediminis]SMC81119.1 TonB-dependent outer membrane receptor, SusC/RagA subfamily, signature region [Moheibacter sediminis]
MKRLILLFLVIPFLSFGQNFISGKVSEFNEVLPVEKVYIHTNNTIFQPGETIYFKGYITDGMQRSSKESSVLYAEIIDPSGSVIKKFKLDVQKGRVSGSYEIPNGSKGGLYKLKAYTNWQKNTKSDLFEKDIMIQRVISPRLLMKLDIEKEAYGSGDEVVANISIRNLQNLPIRNLDFQFTVTIDNKEITKKSAITDENGAYQIKFLLPDNLSGNDGSLNVQFDYEANKESISRTIPILLNSLDLQFLPEGGFALANQPHKIAFKALNKYGNPADVKGNILDENGNIVCSFESFHQGMGSFNMTMKAGIRYFAQITSPYQSIENIPLPDSENKPASLSLERISEDELKVTILSASNQKLQLVGRILSSILYQKELNLNNGKNEILISTAEFPMGILQFTLFKDQLPFAERLIFNHQDKGLKIEIQTDKKEYNTREKVEAKVKTTLPNGDPISSNLSVSVVNDKLLSYLDDKQHNISSWLLAGSELKGNLYEPEFYFNPEEGKRKQALDLLLLTNGWRNYNWQDILSEKNIQIAFPSENLNLVEGTVLKYKSRYKTVPYPTTVYLILDDYLYIEETDENGYFKFNLPAPFSEGSIYAKRRSDENITIQFPEPKKDEILEIKRKPNESYKELSPVLIKENEKEVQDISKEKKGEIGYNNDEDWDWDQDGEVSLEAVTLLGGIKLDPAQRMGSYSIVSQSELSPVTSIDDALNGQVAGLQISGSAGANSQITIRGVGSLSGQSNPLMVVDGVVYSNSNSNFTQNISPSAINSVTVLKGLEATSIYGSRASNGVIIINTKGGISNPQNLNINIGKKTDIFETYYYKRMGDRYQSFDYAKSFYIPKYSSISTANKDDFRQCIYWNYNLTTDEKGEAEFYFYNSDESTVFRIITEGFDGTGNIGRSETTYSTQDKIEMDVKFPLYTTEGDKIQMPVWVKNNLSENIVANLTNDLPRALTLQDYKFNLFLKPDETFTQYVPMLVENGMKGKHKFRVNLLTDTFRQSVTKDLEVFERGFPIRYAKSTIDKTRLEFDAKNVIKGSESAYFTLYLNPIGPILKGIEQIISQPHGCFEQVSSSTFPNIYALKLLEFDKDEESIKLDKKARKYLESGYKKLAAYEVKGGGFDWYGKPPAHETLTAFGLLQFTELRDFVSVDNKMVNRTREWLISRKDSIGGYQQGDGKYGFRGEKYLIGNAYINYALSFSGEKNIEEQYQISLKEAKNSKDAYRLALMALTAHQLGKTDNYEELMEILKSKVFGQAIDKLSAEGSITYSGGKSLKVEILSLYAQALMKKNSISLELNQVMKEIIELGSNGYFGSTQATGLALKSIYQYNKLYNQSAPKGNVLFLKINGEIVVDKTISEYIELSKKENKSSFEINVLKYLKPEKNEIIMEIAAPHLTFVDFSYWYRSSLPDNSKDSKVHLKTSLSKSNVQVGEITQMHIEVKNLSSKEIPMTIAQIGIPGGLSAEPTLLKELIEKEKVDYYEIMDNFLVLYWRKLNPNESKIVDLVFKAEVPGVFTGVASSAYLYYTEEFKHWNEGLKVHILP